MREKGLEVGVGDYGDGESGEESIRLPNIIKSRGKSIPSTPKQRTPKQRISKQPSPRQNINMTDSEIYVYGYNISNFSIESLK